MSAGSNNAPVTSVLAETTTTTGDGSEAYKTAVKAWVDEHTLKVAIRADAVGTIKDPLNATARDIKAAEDLANATTAALDDSQALRPPWQLASVHTEYEQALQNMAKVTGQLLRGLKDGSASGLMDAGASMASYDEQATLAFDALKKAVGLEVDGTDGTSSSNGGTSTEVLAILKAAGAPIGTVTVFTAENDPNKLLGRPGQYVAKFNFVDTRLEQPKGEIVGGTIESFSNGDDLQRRLEYVKGISQSSPMFVEYEYTNGLMLLRLSGDLTPEQAEEYDSVFQSVGQ